MLNFGASKPRVKGGPLNRAWILPYKSSVPCCLHMCTKERCSLGPHVLPYFERTTIKTRVANKRLYKHTYLRFLQYGAYLPNN